MFYLEDHTSKAILFSTDNIFLLNNIKAGILDCRIHSVIPAHKKLFEKLSTRLKKVTARSGLRYSQDSDKKLCVFDLSNYPETKIKYDLINMRLPAFEILLDEHRLYMTRVNFGFSEQDFFHMHYAIKNKTCLEHYAYQTGISKEFALQELELLSSSAIIDSFKVFSLCTAWKKKINNTTKKQDIEKLLPLIRMSFYNSMIFPREE